MVRGPITKINQSDYFIFGPARADIFPVSDRVLSRMIPRDSAQDFCLLNQDDGKYQRYFRRNHCKTPEWIADLEMPCFDLEIQEFLEEHAFFKIFAAHCFHEIFRLQFSVYKFSLKAVSSRVINTLLTKLARDRTGRISALGLFCTGLAALGTYCQDLGPIFSQYSPRA